MFEAIRIEKSGKELRDICRAKLNRDEFSKALSGAERMKLELMANHLTDKYRYLLTLEEAIFLGI